MRRLFRICLVLTIVGLCSCGSTYQLKNKFKKSQEDSHFFKGFVLFNPKTQKEIINHNGNKYFTPASNTKLYTFYAAYKALGDSIKGLEYFKRNDTLYIKGTADPSLLYEFEESKTTPFLKKHLGPIVIVDEHINDDVYGSGWSWSDYQYYYMPEKSLFPIYSNVVAYAHKGDSVYSDIPYFKNHISVVDSVEVCREKEANTFYLQENDTTMAYVPFKTSTKLVSQLLSDTLRKPVYVGSEPKYSHYQTLNSVSADSLYKKMLVSSDNFIAEQLMLQVGKETTDSYNVGEAIDYTLKHFLADLPQEPRWVDGSGLSRYNLFTPEDNVYLLAKMYQEIPLEKLLNYFAVGGKSGTLKNWYGGKEKPFVFAKSGTLSNNYSLSGYLITKKGTLLIFSYMNNHYRHSTSEIRQQIQDLLYKIYESY